MQIKSNSTLIILLIIFFSAVIFGYIKIGQNPLNKKDMEDSLNSLGTETNGINIPEPNIQQQVVNPVMQAQKPATTETPSNNLESEKMKKYTATLNTTEGKITIELNANSTPITVNNFVSLSKKGFYDNTIFHRVVKGFMIQGGDPTGTGMGGPGYQFNDEPFEGEYVRGTVAMANSGPNTNGSQFFIMHQDMALPKAYTIFGKVTEGMEVVDKIAGAKVVLNRSGETSTPETPTKILSVSILEEEIE